jgi:protein TonB
MHLLVGWALLTGLAQRVVEVIRAPIETKIIEDVKPPPPPPPENLPPPPKFAPPPPSYVPPPEVQIQPPPTPTPPPTITTTQTPPPPAPVQIAPPAPPVQAPPAPPAPAPPRAPVRTEPRLNFNACAKPEYPRSARRSGAEGSVIVAYTMDTSGTISQAEIVKSAGPTRDHRLLDRATLEAVLACKGTPGTVDGKPEKLNARIEYVWRLTD